MTLQLGPNSSNFFDPIDPSLLTALEPFFRAYVDSDAELVATGQRTTSLFQTFRANMETHLASLVAENQALERSLAALNSQTDEMCSLHQKEMEVLESKIAFARLTIEEMSHEIVRVALKTDQRIAEVAASKAVAVQAATRLGDSRVAAATKDSRTKIDAAAPEVDKLIKVMSQLRSDAVSRAVKTGEVVVRKLSGIAEAYLNELVLATKSYDAKKLSVLNSTPDQFKRSDQDRRTALEPSEKSFRACLEKAQSELYATRVAYDAAYKDAFTRYG